MWWAGLLPNEVCGWSLGDHELGRSPSEFLRAGPGSLRADLRVPPAVPQKDPANVDYEDLLLYSRAPTREAAGAPPAPSTRQLPSSCPSALPTEVGDGNPALVPGSDGEMGTRLAAPAPCCEAQAPREP